MLVVYSLVSQYYSFTSFNFTLSLCHSITPSLTVYKSLLAQTDTHPASDVVWDRRS